MPNLSPLRLAACVALLMGLAQAAPAAEVLIVDAKSQPESLTIAPGGVLIVGSASSPFVYKVRPGSATAEKFVDASAEGPGIQLVEETYLHIHRQLQFVVVRAIPLAQLLNIRQVGFADQNPITGIAIRYLAQITHHLVYFRQIAGQGVIKIRVAIRIGARQHLLVPQLLVFK